MEKEKEPEDVHCFRTLSRLDWGKMYVFLNMVGCQGLNRVRGECVIAESNEVYFVCRLEKKPP